MKKLSVLLKSAVLITVLTLNINAVAQKPTILINGITALASDVSKFPYWLNAGATLEKGNKVIYIPVLQYNIAAAAGGGNDLQFDSVFLVSTLRAVPANKAWKIESVITDSTIASSAVGGGDNWGGQTVITDTTLAGLGTGASPLVIAQQNATAGQVMQWNGTGWGPATFTSVTDATLTGDGTSVSPLGIAQQGAATGQVLKWDGSAWVPGTTLLARYFVGDFYGGGIIIYVDSTTQHGIIAAKTGNQSSGIRWFQNTTTITGAQSFSDGDANTTTIINAGATASAANICDSYAGEGYNDWFLPAASELSLLCRNQGLFLNQQFYTSSTDAVYWSSTENALTDPASRAIGVSFTDCRQHLNDDAYGMQKFQTYKVRCVRKF